MTHQPFHAALERAVGDALARRNRTLLLDLHSFGMPLPVDIVLGDRDGTTCRLETMLRLEQGLADAGFRTARNQWFRGGHIVAHHASDRVDAVQLELNQRLYLAPEDVDAAIPRPRRITAAWDDTRRRLIDVIGRLRAGPSSSGHDTPLPPRA